MCQYMRFRYFTHQGAGKAQAIYAYTQIHPSLRFSHTQSMAVDEGSDQNLDLYFCWISQHLHLLEAFIHYI